MVSIVNSLYNVPRYMGQVSRQGLAKGLRTGHQAAQWMGQQSATQWSCRQLFNAFERDLKANSWLYLKLGQGWAYALKRASTDLNKTANILPTQIPVFARMQHNTGHVADKLADMANGLNNNHGIRKLAGSLTFSGIWIPAFWMALNPWLAAAHLTTAYYTTAAGRTAGSLWVSFTQNAQKNALIKAQIAEQVAKQAHAPFIKSA